MVVFKDIISTVNKVGLVSVLLLCISLASCISCSDNNGGSTEEMVDPPIDPPMESSTFRNPILNSGADPWVIKDGDEYFVTFTTGINITLLRTNKMSDLRNATTKVIWTPPASGFNSGEIWAPEIHKINNKWYVYYAASDGNNINHRMWILENASNDPFEGTWVDRGQLMLPDNKWAIDASPFEHNGQYYMVWSGWEGDANVQQNIYIAEMQDPLNVIGERFCLLKPTQPWEANNTSPTVSEAPQFLKRNDKIFIFYSAGGCWMDGYSLGIIWMDDSSDPLNPDSWQRYTNNPVFTSNISGNAYGPGHNSFFKSLNNDEDWILYHANPQPGQGCAGSRSLRMQEMTWDNNGFPILGTPEPLNKNLDKPSGE